MHGIPRTVHDQSANFFRRWSAAATSVVEGWVRRGSVSTKMYYRRNRQWLTMSSASFDICDQGCTEGVSEASQVDMNLTFNFLFVEINGCWQSGCTVVCRIPVTNILWARVRRDRWRHEDDQDNQKFAHRASHSAEDLSRKCCLNSDSLNFMQWAVTLGRSVAAKVSVVFLESLAQSDISG